MFSTAPYDVASIRVHNSSYQENGHFSATNGRMSVGNATLRFMVRTAYGIPDALLIGGPSWINEKTFDIQAKKDEVTQVDYLHLTAEQQDEYDTERLIPAQELLEDRFQLKMHHEERVMPFYALVVTKGGLKIELSEKKSDHEQSSPGRAGYGFLSGLGVVGRGDVIAVKVTLDKLAKYLSHGAYGDIDRPVLNKTGLTGIYNFELKWTPSLDPEGDAPSIFTAIQEQLGLKLVPQKGPVTVMVIDHAELPSEN